MNSINKLPFCFTKAICNRKFIIQMLKYENKPIEVGIKNFGRTFLNVCEPTSFYKIRPDGINYVINDECEPIIYDHIIPADMSSDNMYYQLTNKYTDERCNMYFFPRTWIRVVGILNNGKNIKLTADDAFLMLEAEKNRWTIIEKK